jgi:hypothetical protein
LDPAEAGDCAERYRSSHSGAGPGHFCRSLREKENSKGRSQGGKRRLRFSRIERRTPAGARLVDGARRCDDRSIRTNAPTASCWEPAARKRKLPWRKASPASGFPPKWLHFVK